MKSLCVEDLPMTHQLFLHNNNNNNNNNKK